MADSPSPSAGMIRDLFNRIAPVYDPFNQQLSWGLHRVWKQMAVDWSAAQPGDTCLDVCCGSGDLALLLAHRVGEAGRVCGVDFAAAQLEMAREKTPRVPHIAPVQWLEGDALALPFAEARFDAATMGYGLRNLTDMAQGLRELRRVLKPGARAAVLDFHQPRSLGMRQFQRWYLNAIVVPTAERCGLTEEYAYLSPSVERFPNGDRQVEIAQAVGFSSAVHYAIAGGLMGVLVATR